MESNSQPNSGNGADVTATTPKPTIPITPKLPVYPQMKDFSHGASSAVISGNFGEKTVDTNETPPTMSSQAGSDNPIPVVKVLSVRGVEYLFMSIFLWLCAGSFIGLILSLINGQTGFANLSFPLSMLIVSLPGFALLFLRLKKAELDDPKLRLDASKRRLTQATQLLAFLTCLINVITFVYLILQKIGGEGKLELGKAIINMLVILIVAGGILVYYWFDERRRNG